MTRPDALLFTNGQIVLPHRIITEGSVLTNGNTIEAVAPGRIDAPHAETIDLQGAFLCPGFIDIHIHGGADADFMDGTPEAFLTIARLHARYGTTTLMPTTLSSTREELVRTLKAYAVAEPLNTDGAQFAGMHIEGPYFAQAMRGAQDPRFIRDPDPAEYEALVREFPHIKRWSAAPELKGAMAFGRFMRDHGVLPAFAHTQAVYADIEEAFANGYTLATHLYSAMSGVTRVKAHRYAGAVESTFLIDEIDAEIIADGIHLPAPLLKLIVKIKGPDRIALITDAIRAAGMPPGPSRIGSRENGMDIIVEEGVAKLTDRSSFAGSVATFDRLIRSMVRLAEVPLTDAVRMGSTTPARILGLQHRKGSIGAGKDADLVVMDQDLKVTHTIIGGKVIHR